ncbi:hypothetical protein [Paenibacillus sp. FSL P4-0288]|uniref:hypothetical protein n=1 Tax=Paenibacillus sp. FSL P4-0288 TaxID=2921633 RepID=UPI0030F67878
MEEEYMQDISLQSGLEPSTLFLINISKTSFDSMSFVFIDNCISQLQELKNKGFGSVLIMIDGYGDIATEVYEIPEIRNWMTGLFERYPYFLYFINYSIDTHITLLSCIGDIKITYYGEETLSPMEYLLRGIDVMKDVARKNWVITLDDSLFYRIEKSLIDYGIRVNDFMGAAETIKMIRTITNRK